jgi:hypothetical protein
MAEHGDGKEAFAKQISEMVARHERHEATLSEGRRREEERRQEGIAAWKSACDKFILPAFRAVSEHPDFNKGPGLRAEVEERETRVRLIVRRGASSHALTIELDPEFRGIVATGIPVPSGLTRTPLDEPEGIEFRSLSEWSIREKVRAFLAHALSGDS